MTKKIAGFIRAIPSGAPELGISVDIRLVNGGGLVPTGGMQNCTASPTTTNGVTGLFQWSCELSPGPVYVKATAASGAIKYRDGRETMQNGEMFLSDFPDLLNVFTEGIMAGVLNEFLTTKSGLNLTVNTGMAVLQGRLFSTATTRVIAQGANVTLAVRNDLMVLRQYVGGNDIGKQEITLVAGTVNGVDPTLNGDPNIHEKAIYRAALANGGATPTLTDLRTYSSVFLGFNTITPDFLSANGTLSTAAIAQVLKAPTSGVQPVFGSLATTELSDWVETPATNGQYVTFDTGTGKWTPTTLPTFTLSVTDTASIDLTLAGSVLSASAIFGSTGTTVAVGNHNHNAAYSDIAHTHSSYVNSVGDTASIDLTLTGQQITAAAIFGTTATTVAVGNHTHSTYVNAVTDTSSIDLTLAGQSVSAAAIFGTTATTVAVGNHTHSGVYDLVGHTHTGTQTRYNRATKSYSDTSAVADTQLATASVFLASGITYDIIIIGMAQGHMGSGQIGTAQLGVKYEAQATTWGSEVGTELGERPIFANLILSGEVGDGASHTFTLRGQSTGAGTAHFLSGQVFALAIPRTTS